MQGIDSREIEIGELQDLLKLYADLHEDEKPATAGRENCQARQLEKQDKRPGNADQGQADKHRRTAQVLGQAG